MIADHLWQSTLFAILAGFTALAFRAHRANVRYWIWFSASAKFFVPFALLMNLGSRVELSPAAVPVLATPAVSAAIGQIIQPFTVTTPVPLPATATGNLLAPAIAAIWLCGFVAIALIRLRGWLTIRAAVRGSSPLRLPAAVDVRVSPGLLEPGVVGIWRPTLLLPAGILDRLTAPQLEAVLAHELSHVRRRDNLLASVHMAVEAIFWFHPLAWFIGARLVEERERACDEEVLSLGSEPRVYAEGILNVCKLYLESPLTCVSGVTGANLRKRIEGIMNNRIGLSLTPARKVMLAAAAVSALAFPVAVGALRAQSAAPKPKFDVASIRPCADEPGVRRGGESAPGMLRTGCMPLVDPDHLGLIQRAYVRFAEGRPNLWAAILPIQGGPAWIRSALYNITAKAEGNPSFELMQGPMLQALLEDRFKLKIHRQTQQVPVYELTVPKDTSKLKPFQPESCVPVPATFPWPELPAGKQYCKLMVGIRPPAIDAQGATLAGFAQLLSLVVDRPVIDRSGLSTKFDIHLEFAIDQSTPRFQAGGDLARMVQAPADGSTPSIFTALGQLGLKLTSAKGPREIIVIDHIERPSSN